MLPRLVSRAQRNTKRAARSGALQTRDRYELRVRNGPESAVHHSRVALALHRIGDTRGFAMTTLLLAKHDNKALKDAAHEELRGILAYSEEPLVSSDFRKNPNSSIVDAEYTKVIGGNLVKVLSWYDNEWGYSCRVRDLVKFIAQKGM